MSSDRIMLRGTTRIEIACPLQKPTLHSWHITDAIRVSLLEILLFSDNSQTVQDTGSGVFPDCLVQPDGALSR